MRKIFLTSGIIACMACPAFATTDIDYDATNGYSAEGYTNGPTCVEDITGQTEQNTTAEFEAIWTPNISGAITLVSSIYPSNDNTQTALYTGGANNDGLTTASLSTLYGVYGVGIYGSASDANNYAAATPSTPYTQLGTNPSKSGYTFNGFYSGATQVIDNSGAILSAANTQVTSAGGTATWYAHWTPVPTTITYACGTGVTGIGPSTQTSATYDASFYFADNLDRGGCTKDGYHFAGWKCKVENGNTYLTNGDLFGGNGTDTTQSAGSTNAATWLYATGGTINCVADMQPNGISLNWYADAADTEAGASPISVQSEAESCTYGDLIVLPDAQHQPTKSGYHLTGWHLREVQSSSSNEPSNDPEQQTTP